MTKSKKQLAQEFIARLQSIKPDELRKLVDSQAGAELAEFFYAYSQAVALQQKEKLLAEKPLEQLITSILMAGYLIRANEETVNTIGVLPPPTA